jgi:nucleotide-binding universal stress UspA family protein
MKNILFPTDFSEAANHAFIYALHFADAIDASITLLHVYRKPDTDPIRLPPNMQAFQDNFDLHEFENYKDAIPPVTRLVEEQGFTRLPIYHVLEEGEKIVDTILSVVRRDEIDLIIMGTTGAHGLKEVFLGSVAGEVLENADCPVLAVPREAVFDGKLDRIAFATTFTDIEKKALMRIEELAERFGADVYCVNVDTAHTHFYHQRMEKLKAEMGDKSNLHFDVLDGSYVYEELIAYLKKQDIDVLAMVTHRRTFLQELFNYSKTKMVSYHSHTPVLSYQAHYLEA